MDKIEQTRRVYSLIREQFAISEIKTQMAFEVQERILKRAERVVNEQIMQMLAPPLTHYTLAVKEAVSGGFVVSIVAQTLMKQYSTKAIIDDIKRWVKDNGVKNYHVLNNLTVWFEDEEDALMCFMAFR